MLSSGIAQVLTNNNSKANKWGLGLLLLAVAFVLAGDLMYPKSRLIYDDAVILNNNQFVATHDYKSIWTKPYWEGVQFLYQHESLYRPIFLSLVTVLQRQTQILHAFVLFCHLALTYLLFWFLSVKRKGPYWISCLVALVFLLNPAQVEVTAQIIGMQETVPLLLGLLALFTARVHPGWACALVFAAPGFKETGFIWVASVFIWFARERKYFFSAVAMAIAVFWIGLRWNAVGSLSATTKPYALLNPLVSMNFTDGLLSRIAILGHHVRLLFWPAGLSSDYSWGSLPLPATPFQIWVWVALVFCGLLVWKRKFITWESGTAMVTLVPVLHIFALAGIIFADRFGYGFRWGLLSVLAIALSSSLKSRQVFVKPLAALGLIAISLFLFMNLNRQKLWTEPLLLFYEDVTTYPADAKAHFNYGIALFQEHHLDEAKFEFNATITQAPDFSDAHLRLGMVYRELRDSTQAREQFKIAAAMGNPMAATFLLNESRQ